MVVDVIMVLPLWRWVGVLTGDGMRELSGIMEMLNVLIWLVVTQYKRVSKSIRPYTSDLCILLYVWYII